MKKAKNDFIVKTALFGLFSLLPLAVEARMVPPNPTGASADAFCAGGRLAGNSVKSATEVCIDANGNVIPTTNNTGSVGISTLEWTDIEAINIGLSTVGVTNLGQGAALSAAISTVAVQTGTVNTVLAQGLFGNHLTVLSTTNAYGLIAQSTIPVLGSYEQVISTGGNVRLTTTPQISSMTILNNGASLPVTSGTWLILTSTTGADTVTLVSSGTLSGSGLRLGASTRTIQAGTVLGLIWDQTTAVWKEMFFAP